MRRQMKFVINVANRCLKNSEDLDFSLHVQDFQNVITQNQFLLQSVHAKVVMEILLSEKQKVAENLSLAVQIIQNVRLFLTLNQLTSIAQNAAGSLWKNMTKKMVLTRVV